MTTTVHQIPDLGQVQTFAAGLNVLYMFDITGSLYFCMTKFNQLLVGLIAHPLSHWFDSRSFFNPIYIFMHSMFYWWIWIDVCKGHQHYPCDWQFFTYPHMYNAYVWQSFLYVSVFYFITFFETNCLFSNILNHPLKSHHLYYWYIIFLIYF